MNLEPPYLEDLLADAVPEFGDARTLLRIHNVDVVLEYEAVLTF